MVIGLFAASAPAWAATVSLSVGVPELAVGQGTSITVTLVGAAPASTPEFPPIEGVRLSYSSRSNQFVSSPDGIVQTYRFTYEATCLTAGQHVVGPATLRTRQGDVSGGQVTLACAERAAALPADPLTVTASFDRSTVWEGEVVAYRLRLVAQTPIRDVQYGWPDFAGLQVLSSPLEGTSIIRDPAGDVTIADALVPLLAAGTGDRSQPPTVARVGVLLRGSTPFGLPQTRVKHVTTQVAPLTVRPLPAAPPEFSGLVGDFLVRSELARTEGVAVGESVPWTLEVSGSGSTEGFDLVLPPVPDAQIYRDGSTHQAKFVDGAYRSSKKFALVLVPTRPGRMELPPLELVVFSPEKGQYVTLKVPLGSLEVVGQGAAVDVRTFGSSAPVEGPPPVELVDVYTWGPSITPPLAPLVPAGLALAALPGLLALGLDGRDGLRAWWSSRRVRRAVSARGRGRMRGLPADPRARLATMDLALREALADRVRTPVGQLQRDAALAALEPEEAAPTREAFVALDRARFADGALPDDLQVRVEAALDALGAA